MSECEIRKGGILWDKENNIQANSVAWLFEQCTIQKGVTLKDILVLLRQDMTTYVTILGNWVDEIVNEGLTSIKEPDDKVEKLELYWSLEREIYKGKKSFSGYHFPSFHGLGYKDKDGAVTNYAVEFTPVGKLIEKEVVLRENLGIFTSDLDNFKMTHNDETFNDATYTLGHILHGIIWELSFLGSPVDRDEKADEINQSLDDIKSGDYESKTYRSVDDFLKDLRDED